ASSDKTFCDLSTLLTLKLSHSGWDINWVKTVKDISFLKSWGAVVNEELYGKLVQYWETVHKDKTRINFNKPVREFFGTV
ncbi:hypothetical protein, partial [Streptococcus pneumoniae]|uniref:DUF7275 domain-containing protein n=1 Tax=Streptococcus pneumoniae TaxID=1313 RepID=UPI001E5D2C6D